MRVPGVFYESVDCNGHVSQAGELRLRFFYSDAGGILTARWRGSGTASFARALAKMELPQRDFQLHERLAKGSFDLVHAHYGLAGMVGAQNGKYPWS